MSNRSNLNVAMLRSAPCWIALATTLAAMPAQSQDLQRLQSLLSAAAPGTWIKVNTTSFSSAFPVGSVAVPESGISDPGRVVSAWSSFTWDSNRGNLMLFGGGHYNYLGNEMYLWNSASGAWSRGSLPSFIDYNTWSVPDNSAPQSAHTYDNNVFLPANDRFLTFGGAVHAAGGSFSNFQNGAYVRTGPWVWDPNLADPNKVGGSAGSGWNSATAGGNMWTNRRPMQVGPTLGSAINGTTATRVEGGNDVIYVTADTNQSGWPLLYKYTLGNASNGGLDTIEWIGRNTYQNDGYEGAGTIDSVRNYYVRTIGAPGKSGDLLMWNLTGATSTNLATDFIVDLVNLDGSPFSLTITAGLDFDPALNQYFAWDGANGGTVYTFKAEFAGNGSLLNTWHVTTLAGTAAPHPTGNFLTGVFGKWKYVDQINAYVALDEYNGGTGDAGVWLYKPLDLTAAVPEPTTLLTMGLGGLLVLGCARARRTQRRAAELA